MTQEQTNLHAAVERSPARGDAQGPDTSRPVHVVTLITAMPLIGALAALMVWWMGGTGWQIALSVLASWLLIQLFYAAQLAFYATRRTASEPAQLIRPRHAEGTVPRAEIDHEGPARKHR